MQRILRLCRDKISTRKSVLILVVAVSVLFCVNATNVFAYTLIDSGNLSVSAVVSSTGGGGVGGGGGGGGGGYGSPTTVTFSGRAYPLSRVILLKDGQEVINTVSGPDARFIVTISGLTTGTFTFSILSEDSAGRRSTLFTIPISVTAGVSSTISGIFLSPTIDINKQQIKKGETLTIFGQTAPGSEVTISVHSTNPIFAQTHADSSGIYLYNLNTSPLEYGKHSTQSKAELVASNEVTSYGKVLTFIVGDKTIDKKGFCDSLIADFNGDCRVNLVDFSILAYWYKKTTFPPRFDLNKDSKISFVDFSIMAYYWTG